MTKYASLQYIKFPNEYVQDASDAGFACCSVVA